MVSAIVRCFLPVLLALMIGVAAYAHSEDAPGKICHDNGDFGFSHSTCVVCIAQGGPEESRVCFCKSLGLSGEEYGHCVSGVGASSLSIATFSILFAAAVLLKVRRQTGAISVKS